MPADTTTMRGALFLLLITILGVAIDQAMADLPSCHRARCTHCVVEFIAKMCPSACSSCGHDYAPLYSGAKLRSISPGTVSAAAPFPLSAGGARIHGAATAAQQTISTTQQRAESPAASSAVGQPHYSAPQAKQLPPAAYSPQHQNAATPYNAYQTVQTQQQPQQQYYSSSSSNTQPQLQQYSSSSNAAASPQHPQYAQTTSYGSSYAPSGGYPPANGGVPQYATASSGAQPAFGFQQAPQPQPIFSQPQQLPPAAFQPQPQPPQQSGFFQPPSSPQVSPAASAPAQMSPFINPFQPFLQQSFQAQSPFFQPFTPFPPSPQAPAATPFGAPPPAGGINVLPPPAPSLPTFTGAAQPPYIYPPQQTGQQYIQTGQSQQQLVAEQARPRQLYNNNNLPQQQTQASSIYGQQQTQQQLVDPTYAKNNLPDDKSLRTGGGGTCPKQPNWEPCVAKDVANERFRNCCQRLGDGCTQLCSYDSTLATIQIAVLTGRCPISKVADMMICASGNEDATSCCQAYNVFEPGFEHCRPYCNPAAGLPNDGMLAEKYRCLGKLSQIQRCFYVSQKP